MFDSCLSKYNLYSDTGCDNMTAIIVQFKSVNLKRPLSPSMVGVTEKRAKTDECESNVGAAV